MAPQMDSSVENTPVLSEPSRSSMRRSGSESEMSEMGDSPKKSYRDYRVRKSRLIGLVDWTHVIGTYVPQLFIGGFLLLGVFIVQQVVADLLSRSAIPSDGASIDIATIVAVVEGLKDLFASFFEAIVRTHTEALFSPAVEITALALIVIAWLVRMDNPVYLMAFSTFKPPESWKVSQDQLVEIMRRQNCFTQDSLDFMRKLLARSGTGQATAWPPGIVQCLEGKPTDRSIEGSRKEAETVIFNVVEQALKRSKVHPREIDVLVINCSLFSPTPSLCAMVISKFGLRSDVMSYNLSGMGCGASLISVDLAKQLLQRRNFGGKALVVSTEIITPNLYHGNERSFLLQNTLFRCGGAAMILSNRWTDGRKAWYKLLHTVRVQGTGEDAYGCVYETEDPTGQRGVRLSKDIVKVAGKCMEKNMTMIGPYVLPLTEQTMVVLTLVTRFVLKMMKNILISMKKDKWTYKLPVVKQYVPDFKTGIDHFCIHAGGRAVIDGIEKNMKLEPFHTEPSRMTLLNMGNTSSSSIWYELEYIMTQQTTNPLKKGDRVMQVAFGSGFKCTSGVWLKL